MAREQVRLERIFKGVANHRRIEMLQILERDPNLSVVELAQRAKVDLTTASEHLRKLAIAGLVWKNRNGRKVEHVPSDRGRQMLAFIRDL